MRGIDTNVLVRFVTRDDTRQAAIADRLISRAESDGEQIHVTAVVLCELVWVLSGEPFHFDRASIAALLAEVLETPVFDIHGRDRVRRALDSYRTGGADFADYLIGEECLKAGCSEVLTFDRRLRRAPGFAVLDARA